MDASRRKKPKKPDLDVVAGYWRDRIVALVRRDPPIPHPKSSLPTAMKKGFARIGEANARVLQQIGGLQPTHRVLDAGCGAGRVARPLTRYIEPPGSYEGFDVVEEAIEWCRRSISSRHPHFGFTYADIRNEAYNPDGRWLSSEFPFPYPDDDFDLVFMFSVFTHMFPADVERYLMETARVLRPGGRSLINFFVLNESSEAAIREGRASRRFAHEGPGYRSDHPKVPERSIAYREEDVRAFYDKAGLEIEEPILYGRWAGGTGRGNRGQDIVLARKPA